MAATFSLSLLLGALLAAFAPTAQTAAPPTLGFGLRMDLTGGSNTSALLNAAQIMKTDWLAQQVQWKDLEPRPGQYQWLLLDKLALAARPYGFRILLSVAGAPDWARSTGSDLTLDGPPIDAALFANFMSVLSRRYAGVIGAYEIWPEANIAAHWSTAEGISPERYTELLRQASLAIHSADPFAIVISGGLAPTGANDEIHVIDDLSFYQRMYTAGAANYFDALGVRVDGYNNPPGDTPEFSTVATQNYKGHTSFYFRHYEAVRAIMLANNDAEKNIWLTSVGWATMSYRSPEIDYAADVTEQQQASYLAEALAQAQAQPYISLIFINNFNFSTLASAPVQQAAYSLIRADWSARPAFTTLAQLRQGNAFAQQMPNPNATAAPLRILPNWQPRLRYLFQPRQP